MHTDGWSWMILREKSAYEPWHTCLKPLMRFDPRVYWELEGAGAYLYHLAQMIEIMDATEASWFTLEARSMLVMEVVDHHQWPVKRLHSAKFLAHSRSLVETVYLSTTTLPFVGPAPSRPLDMDTSYLFVKGHERSITSLLKGDQRLKFEVKSLFAR